MATSVYSSFSKYVISPVGKCPFQNYAFALYWCKSFSVGIQTCSKDQKLVLQNFFSTSIKSWNIIFLCSRIIAV